MKSTPGEIGHGAPAFLISIGAGVVGAVLALVLGLLTFGVQATVDPRHVPLAVGTADASAAPALSQLVNNIAAEGGDRVDWRMVASRDEAQSLLDGKMIYGAVLFSPGPAGLTATVLVSGALNPNATAVAQPILTQLAEGATSAARAQRASQAPPAGTAPAASPATAVQVVTLHPTSAAGRTLPLAGSALLWIAALVGNVFVLAAAPRLRGGKPLGRIATIGAAASAAVLGTGAVLLLAWLWDSTLPIGWEVGAFLAMVGVAFALLQAGVLRWLGLAGMAVLAPLYLMAPAVAGLPPELLNAGYRAALWSWTPFRFSTEGLRSVMFLGSGAPDVQSAVLVLGGLAVAGLLLLLVPKPASRMSSAELRHAG
jgi:hypothetical protein